LQVEVDENAMARRRVERQFPRAVLCCRVSYLRIPKRATDYRSATVHDICQGGFRFHTDELFRRRSCFLLDLFLPGAQPIRSLATVVWVAALPGDGGYQIGGRFIEPNPDVATAIAHLVSDENRCQARGVPDAGRPFRTATGGSSRETRRSPATP
jgi:hypothetical protein